MRRLSDPSLKKQYIEEHSLHDHLSDEMIKAVSIQEYSPGEYLYHQGEEAHSLFILVEGKLQTDYYHPNGDLTVLSHSNPLSTIGDLELFDDIHTVKNVIALERSVLLAGSLDLFRDFGKDDPIFLRFIHRQIVRKLDSSSNQIALSSLPLINRLARYLSLQLNDKGTTFDLERREVLAGILGTSVRHLNRTLKTLSEKGIILVQHRKIEVIDPQELSKTITLPS